MQRLEALLDVPPPKQFPWALQSATVTQRDLTIGFPVLATLNAQTEVAITPRISGTIEVMELREGQPVSKGEVLAQLDVRELTDQLAALTANFKAAEAKVALSEKELARQKALLGDGYTTQANVDKLSTALQTDAQMVSQLQSDIAALKTHLTYGSLLSPVDGFVTARLQEPGDLAVPGQVIYRISATKGAEIRITVPQSVAAQLHDGSEVMLQHGDKTIRVAIKRVFPSLDALSMGTAEADLDSIPFGLPSGTRLPGRVILERHGNALVVPRTALILTSDGKGATVFRITPAGGDGLARLEKLQVKIVASGREGVAISGPVSAGDQIAVARENELLKLKDGDPTLPEPAQGG